LTNLSFVQESNFQTEVLNNSLPVLVDFTAVWCGPCKMLEPVVSQIAQNWAKKVKVVKLDIDENLTLTSRYQVMGVPTLMLFVEGKPVERVTGYQPLDRIEEKLKKHVE
jgi:thioredoxin 1